MLGLLTQASSVIGLLSISVRACCCMMEAVAVRATTGVVGKNKPKSFRFPYSGLRKNKNPIVTSINKLCIRTCIWKRIIT